MSPAASTIEGGSTRLMSILLALAIAGVFVSCGRQTRSTPTSTLTYNVEEKTIATLQEDMRAGRVTASELVATYLDRIKNIDQTGPTLHSLISVNPRALDDATVLDDERKSGHVRGPLHGIPIVIKDNIESQDPIPTTAGSLALAQNVTNRDAPIVARLRAAGAIVLGKTNLSEWANFRSITPISGWSGVGGFTRNPYVLDRTPLGSSSGSAVAVAANLAAAGIGTETNGSITMPSAVNGVVGIKPTVGLLSRTRIVPISHLQDTAGPIARTVSDAAVLLSVMAGTDPEDPETTQANAMKRDYASGLSGDGLRGKRIGVLKFLTGYHAGLDHLFDDTLQVLKSLGLEMVVIDSLPGFPQLIDREIESYVSGFQGELETYFSTMPTTVPIRTLQDLIAFNRTNSEREMKYFGQEMLERTLHMNPAEREKEQAAARTRKSTVARALDGLFKRAGVDVFVAPSANPAVVVDVVNGDLGLGGSPALPAVAGYPHITVPMGSVSGLPVAISFIGPAWSEATLLNVAFAYEQRTHARRPPTYRSSVTLESQP